MGQARENLLEGAAQGVLADQGEILLALVTPAQAGTNLPLRATEVTGAAQLDKDAQQALAVEQRLGVGQGYQ